MFAEKMSREELNTILNRFFDKTVQLRSERKREALNSWEPIVKKILDYVKRKDRRFAFLQTFPTGGYYERTKVIEPDEFDLMLVMDNLELDGEPYDEDDGLNDPPIEFTTVMIDQGEEELWRPDKCVNSRGMLSSTQVKAVFARLVREAIREQGYGSSVTVSCHGPAVTLKITKRNGREYSVDLALAIKDKSWPEDADEWKTRSRNGWPKKSLVHEICQDGCHLVAKPPKGHSVPECEKEFLWRYSFSASTKKLFLQGGHNEPSSCRKQVFRILKALREELHLQPLKTFHLKNILLYECEANPHTSQWSYTCLSERFLGLLQRLENCLRQSNCPDYFIRDVNLFELFDRQKCSELAERVKKIRLQPGKELIKLIQ